MHCDGWVFWWLRCPLTSFLFRGFDGNFDFAFEERRWLRSGVLHVGIHELNFRMICIVVFVAAGINRSVFSPIIFIFFVGRSEKLKQRALPLIRLSVLLHFQIISFQYCSMKTRTVLTAFKFWMWKASKLIV